MAKAPTGKTFNGSSGNDTISGTAYGGIINGNGGNDTITGNGGAQERLDLSQIDVDASTPEIETVDWIFVGEEDRADVGAAQATLHYDSAREGTVLRLFLADGDSEADFELLILGDPVDQTMLIGVTDLP
jgi:Ca2+-binding RTX toxin-like protein